jgi:hypothetical protein
MPLAVCKVFQELIVFLTDIRLARGRGGQVCITDEEAVSLEAAGLMDCSTLGQVVFPKPRSLELWDEEGLILLLPVMARARAVSRQKSVLEPALDACCVSLLYALPISPIPMKLRKNPWRQDRPCASTCTDATSGTLFFFVFTLLSAFVLMQVEPMKLCVSGIKRCCFFPIPKSWMRVVLKEHFHEF